MAMQSSFQTESLAQTFIRARESLIRSMRGQTVMEYTLVAVTILVAVSGVYLAFGKNLSSLASGLDSTVTNA